MNSRKPDDKEWGYNNGRLWRAVCLRQLPPDFRRIISVQLREFVHHLDDSTLYDCLSSRLDAAADEQRRYKDAA